MFIVAGAVLARFWRIAKYSYRQDDRATIRASFYAELRAMVLLEEMEVESGGAFDWDSYFDKVGGAPADGGLFQHVDMSTTSYMERRFTAGQIVEVEAAEGAWNPAKIVLVCGQSVYAEVISDDEARRTTSWFKLPSVRYCEKAEEIAESERTKAELSAQLAAEKEKQLAESSNDSDE